MQKELKELSNYFVGEGMEYISAKNILDDSINKCIEKLYKQKDIDLSKIDANFKTYGLISLDAEHMSIFCDKYNQILEDKRLNQNFSVLFDKRLLLECLNDLLTSKHLIGELSFRIDSICNKSLIMCEERDYGAKLNYKINSLPNVSRFYELSNYENGLFIFHNKLKKQISFEEVCEDFNFIDNKVITQLVHLEYINYEESGYLLTHIDHEYIIYTLDEYDKRLKDHKIKGHRKVKTFKVNNARIPFFYKYKDDFFLFIVLNSFFAHKELLQEYFENLD